MKKLHVNGAGLRAIIRDTAKDGLGSGRTNDEPETGKKNLARKSGLEDKAPQGHDLEMLIESLKLRAIEFDKAGNLLDSFHLYRRVLRLNPNDTQALYQLATIYYSAEIREKAIECLRAVVEIDPKQERARESLKQLRDG